MEGFGLGERKERVGREREKGSGEEKERKKEGRGGRRGGAKGGRHIDCLPCEP